VWPTAEPDLFIRDEALRTDPQRVRDLWRSPDRRVVAVYKGHVDVNSDVDIDPDDLILLGTVDGVPWFAARTRTPTQWICGPWPTLSTPWSDRRP
jgi:hypothetical protein